MLNIYKFISRNFMLTTSLTVVLMFTNTCGLYKKSDARTIPAGGLERAKKNIEEGRGAGLAGIMKRRGNTNYEFSTSNPMWRASLETLDFIPLSNVDYSGGVIITDWYTDKLNSKEAIKISVQFLSNEVRTDSIKINIYKKECNANNICRVQLTESKIKDELLRSILNKAARLEKTDKIKK